MILKFSSFSDPIKDTIKYFSSKAKNFEELKENYGKEKFITLDPPTQKQVCLTFKNEVVQPRKEISDRWEGYLFNIGMIQGVAFVAIVIVGYQNQEVSKILTSKKVVVLGPCMKFSIGVFPMIALTKLTIKFISVYYKKQLTDAESRSKFFLHEIVLKA